MPQCNIWFSVAIDRSHTKAEGPGVAFSIGCVLCAFLAGAFEGGFTWVYALAGGQPGAVCQIPDGDTQWITGGMQPPALLWAPSRLTLGGSVTDVYHPILCLVKFILRFYLGSSLKTKAARTLSSWSFHPHCEILLPHGLMWEKFTEWFLISFVNSFDLSVLHLWILCHVSIWTWFHMCVSFIMLNSCVPSNSTFIFENTTNPTQNVKV